MDGWIKIKLLLLPCVRTTRRMWLTWRVAPGLVVRSEHPQVTAPDKVLVVQAKQRIGGVQKLGVKHNLEKQCQRSYITEGHSQRVWNKPINDPRTWNWSRTWYILKMVCVYLEILHIMAINKIHKTHYMGINIRNLKQQLNPFSSHLSLLQRTLYNVSRSIYKFCTLSGLTMLDNNLKLRWLYLHSILFSVEKLTSSKGI